MRLNIMSGREPLGSLIVLIEISRSVPCRIRLQRHTILGIYFEYLGHIPEKKNSIFVKIFRELK
jgi:CBS domain containing-hemolysin-like protein